jgi:hypothetical protein
MFPSLLFKATSNEFVKKYDTIKTIQVPLKGGSRCQRILV